MWYKRIIFIPPKNMKYKIIIKAEEEVDAESKEEAMERFWEGIDMGIGGLDAYLTEHTEIVED